MTSRSENKKEERQEEVQQVAETAAVAAAEASWPQTRAILRVIIIVLFVAAFMWVLYRIQGVILLIVLSIFFAYLVAPLVEFVRRPFNVRGRAYTIPRAVAIGIVYLVIFGSIILSLRILLPKLSSQVADFARNSDTFKTNAIDRVKALNEFCTNNGIPPNACGTLKNTLNSSIDSAKNYLENSLPGLIAQALLYVPWLILIPILSFFLLKDANSFRRSALQMLPRGRWRWRGDEFFQDVNSTLAAYIRAQLTICLLIGIACTLGFVAIGVPSPLVLGVLAGMLEFIPLVGPLVIAIIAALVTGFSNESPTHSVLWVILFLGTLRIVNDYVIYPRIIGQGIHLHPLAVILAILSGAELAGITGIFLAIPVIAIATVSYRHWLEHRGSEGLVADILQPTEETVSAPAPDEEMPVVLPRHESDAEDHPTADTTPEEMVRARPDLTTGELKMPKMD